MTIGDRIKQRRKQLQMTQDELAKRLGYKSRSSINKIELGQQNLTQPKIHAIALALETTPSFIMGWKEKVHICTERKEVSGVEFKCPLSGHHDSEKATINHCEAAYKAASEKMDDFIEVLQKTRQESRENCDRIRRWCIEDSLEVRSYLTGLLIAVVGMAIILGVVVAYLLMG